MLEYEALKTTDKKNISKSIFDKEVLDIKEDLDINEKLDECAKEFVASVYSHNSVAGYVTTRCPDVSINVIKDAYVTSITNYIKNNESFHDMCEAILNSNSRARRRTNRDNIESIVDAIIIDALNITTESDEYESIANSLKDAIGHMISAI